MRPLGYFDGPALLNLVCLAVLSSTVSAQITALVSIDTLPDYRSAGQNVKDCLWEPGHHDIAYSLSCNTETVYNLCFCPTDTAGRSTASSVITGCLTYWFSSTGALQVATALTVYNEYCTQALALPASTSATTTATSSATSSADTGGGSSLGTGAIAGIAVGCVLGVVIFVFIMFIVLYFWCPPVTLWVNDTFGKGKPSGGGSAAENAVKDNGADNAGGGADNAGNPAD